jgi:hypothetical protein
LTHIDFLDEQVADCNGKIEQVLSALSGQKAEQASCASDDQPQEQVPVSSTLVGTEAALAADRVPEDGPKAPLSSKPAIALLDSIPGINQRIAEIFIAEVGTDMQRFPTAGHLARLQSGSARATIKVRENRSVARRARGIVGCVKPSSKLRRGRCGPKIPT